MHPPLAPLPASLRLLRRFEFRGKLRVFEALYGSRLARLGTTWVETHPGIPWELDLANVTHRWIVYGYYEGPAFWRWMLAHTSRIRTVFDSGANIGQTSLYFAKLLPHARIFAYEPGSAARAWLTRGVEGNALTHVSVSPAGLGATSGYAFLRSLGDESTHGSWNQIDATEGERIPIASVDDEMTRLGLDRIDLWKLDMEGGEPAALAGAARALAAGRIGAIHAELLFSAGTGIGDTLCSYGYRPFVARRDRLVPVHGPLGREGDNAVFIHPSSGMLPPE